MQPVKRLDGTTSYHFMDFKISATVVQDQAVNAEIADTGGGYITDAATTSLVDFVGSVLGASSFNPQGGGAGTLTYSATQGDTEGLVRVYITPDIIYRARMSNGATLADLQTVTNDTANTAGTTITAADTPDNDMDDGTCWGVAPNANAGLSRRVTTYTANTSFVVTVPFPRTIAVNDTFHVVPYSPFVTTAIQLTTDLINADASIAFGTGGNARVVELVLNGAGDSFVHFIARDHALNELS